MNFESLHARMSVTHVTFEMHDSFNKWEAFSESLDIVGSLWIVRHPLIILHSDSLKAVCVSVVRAAQGTQGELTSLLEREKPSVDYIHQRLSLFEFSVSSTTKSFFKLFLSFQLTSHSEKNYSRQ
jgi:hypothetical protein